MPTTTLVLLFVPLILFALKTMPVIGFYARVLLSLLCLCLCALYGVFASLFLRLIGYGGLSQWTVARAFKWTMWAAVGVEFEVLDQQNLGVRPAVFVGNHQTELDVLMLGCVFPPYCSVTSKKSLKYWPFLGWFMAASQTVFIDRNNRASARASFDGAAHTMRTTRQSVFIFPEGTRSYTTSPDMLPFKKGAFHLAVQAGVPVVPVVVANYSNILSLQRRVFVSGKVPCRVLEPVETTGLGPGDVDELAGRVRAAMLEELGRLSRSEGVRKKRE